MSQSIKVNYIFSLINTLAGILFPLITFPYASRIMEADGIGQVGFFTSLIGYISLFTSLGIPIYAIREIAKTRDNNIQMSKTAIEILLLHSSLVVIGYIVVALMCFCVDKVSIDIPLFLILSLSIFFNAIGCEWFYQGIEEFKYIAVRGLIVRLLYVIFFPKVFMLEKNITFKKIHEKIFEYFKKIINLTDNFNKYFNILFQNNNINGNNINEIFGKYKLPYIIKFKNIFYDKYKNNQKCILCNKNNCESCILPYNDMTLNELINKFPKNRYGQTIDNSYYFLNP
jgi:hypothetical protein